MLFATVFAALVVAIDASPPAVLVTGATGRTGVVTYKRLQSEGYLQVRAFVRNVTKARAILGCNKCDEGEGIFVGDINDKKAVANAMLGVDMLVIATAAVPHCTGVPVPPFGSCSYPKGGMPKDVDWEGTKAQVTAYASTGDISSKHIVFVSAGGTTVPNSFLDKLGNGQISFYKLNAESFIMNSGVPFTILKPCGLGEGVGGKKKLIVGHDDSINLAIDHLIQRDDVARVIVEALRTPTASKGLRFDLCSQAWGAPTKDIVADVFKAAMYPWDSRVGPKAGSVVV